MDIIDVWFFDLNRYKINGNSATKFLSKKDHNLSTRMPFHDSREQFLLSRALLRIVKNYYRAISSPAATCCSVSHSRRFLAMAFSPKRKIGLDVEYLRELSNADHIASKLVIEYDDQKNKSMKIIKTWTALESIGKLDGCGVLLSKFFENKKIREGTHLKIIVLNEHSIHRLKSPSGYTSSLAVEGREAIQVKYRTFDRTDDQIRTLGHN